jgi:hypothetical protein
MSCRAGSIQHPQGVTISVLAGTYVRGSMYPTISALPPQVLNVNLIRNGGAEASAVALGGCCGGAGLVPIAPVHGARTIRP